MAKTPFASVDDYLDAQPEGTRAVLERVRAILKKALPGADESISYNIPTFKLNGKPVLYLSGWKAHYALYPFTGELVASMGEELAPYQSSKGTLKFSLAESVPAGLIARIARARVKEVAAGAAPRRTASSKARRTTQKKTSKKK